MRIATSLNDISNVVCDVVPSSHPSALGILSSLPTVQDGTRLSIFYSSAAVLNSQVSATKQQIYLLQAENTTLKDAVKVLTARNESLATENEALRDQKAKLENEKQKLVDELRVEKFQGTIRIKKACENRSKIMKLLDAAKQRDAFIHAMIDIKLHQPVFKDAYTTVKNGQPADRAIIKAIQSAASKPGSPWSGILAPLDVAKSDLYKCAIELAATARLRTDESVQIARFWKHVAKYDNQNIGVVTPSSSALDLIDAELRKEERGTILDDLLERLRAGEDIRLKKEKEKKPIFVVPDTSSRIPTSPTSAFFDWYRKNARRYNPCFPSLLPSMPTLNSIPCLRRPLDDTVLNAKRDSDFFAPDSLDHTSPAGPASSLERICGAFMTSDNEETLEDSETPSVNSFGRLNISPCPLQSVLPFAAGRNRSATFPFSKKDLALPPVKNVASKLVIVTSPGGKEREAQTTQGQRVRFNSGTSLARSKAVTARRPRIPHSGIKPSPMRKATPKVSTPLGKHVPNSAYPPSPTRKVNNLPTPPSEGDSITYIRPPTVTRKRGSGPLPYETTPAFNFPSSLAHVSPSPQEEKTRPYAVGGPNLASSSKLNLTLSEVSFRASSSGSTSVALVPMATSRGNLIRVNKKPKPPPLGRVSESDKENVPPQRVSGVNRSSRSSFTPASLASASSGGLPGSPRNALQRAPPMLKPVIPLLKPVQPLRIVKKNPVQRPTTSATTIKPVSAPSPISPPRGVRQRISHLPRSRNSTIAK